MCYDPIFRVRKGATYLIEHFNYFPKNFRLCIDEQMCPIKIVHHLRQFLSDILYPWCIKSFAVYTYRFEIYTRSNNHDIILSSTPKKTNQMHDSDS